jgi:multidrug efflux pump subunit AcrA (membrane-fusion protein)
VLRVDPLADPVTEETMAKVVFDRLPDPRPPVGELVEVTVALPAVAAAPVIPQAALHRVEGRWGVWRVVSDDLQFVPVSPGIADLEGLMQVREGLEEGDQVVVYSESALTPHRSIRIVDHIKGVTR